MAGPAPGQSFGAWMAQYQRQQEEGDEEQGFLSGIFSNKAFGEAPTQVNAFFNNVVSNLKGEEGLGAEAKRGVETALQYSNRMLGFVGLLLAGVIFYLLAFFVALPVIVLRPAKFALSVTMGSILTMGSFTYLIGPGAHLKSLCTKERFPVTFAYAGSLLFTLYACLVARSYILTFASTIIQILAFAFYAFGAMPGGAAGLRVLYTILWRMMTGTIKGCGQMCACCLRVVS